MGQPLPPLPLPTGLHHQQLQELTSWAGSRTPRGDGAGDEIIHPVLEFNLSIFQSLGLLSGVPHPSDLQHVGKWGSSTTFLQILELRVWMSLICMPTGTVHA